MLRSLYWAMLITLMAAMPVAAQNKPVPDNMGGALQWTGMSLMTGDKATVQMMRKEYPKFNFVYNVDPSYPPIFGANRTVDLNVANHNDATAAVHDAETGEVVFACQLPCSARLASRTDYFVSFRADGHIPEISFLSMDYPAGAVLHAYFGPNLYEHAKTVVQCWTDHKAAGFPDIEATPCSRFGPSVPHGAERSGHCYVQFDVAPTGWLTNTQVLSCTEPHFENGAKQVLDWWYYTPETQLNQPVTRTGLETKLVFNVTDEFGNVIDDDGRIIVE